MAAYEVAKKEAEEYERRTGEKKVVGPVGLSAEGQQKFKRATDQAFNQEFWEKKKWDAEKEKKAGIKAGKPE